MGYLEKLEFTKDWTDASDFPTYEPDESQVRADLQLLHNEAKAAINALVDKLESAEFASHLAVSAEGMTATNLAAALAEILATAKAAQAGTIVDGTVTEAKLAAALVQKINSIDVTYSMNAPTANETPTTGYQLGKLWLKPEFSVANLASDYALASGADWTGENVTKEAADGKLTFSGTGDSRYGAAQTVLTAAAGTKVRVYLAAEKTAGQFASLKLALNGSETALTDGVMTVREATADSNGQVTVKVTADWSNTTTAAGGKFSVAAFAAVNKAAVQLPGAAALTDANLDALVQGGLPLSALAVRLELYGQQTAGVWKKLVPDESLTSDELRLTDAAAETLGVEQDATLSRALAALKAYLDAVKTVLNGGTAEGIRTLDHCVVGSYVGDGTCGAAHPNSLMFDFVPKLVELIGYEYVSPSGENERGFFTLEHLTTIRRFMCAGSLTAEYQKRTGFGDTYNYGRLDGKTISWYAGGSDASAEEQMNQTGRRYYYRVMG